MVLGSALGPFPFGLCRDLTGSFTAAFDAGAALSLGCLVAVLRYGHAPVAQRAKGKEGAKVRTVAKSGSAEVELASR